MATTKSSLLVRERRPTSLRAIKDELPRREEPGPETFFADSGRLVADDQPVRYCRWHQAIATLIHLGRRCGAQRGLVCVGGFYTA